MGRGGGGGGSAQRRDSQRAGGQDSKGRRGKTGPGRDWAGHGGLRNISVQTGSLGWRGGQGRGGEGPLAGPRREAVGPECLVTPSPAQLSGLGRAHGGEVWGGWPRSSVEPWQPLVCGAGSVCPRVALPGQVQGWPPALDVTVVTVPAGGRRLGSLQAPEASGLWDRRGASWGCPAQAPVPPGEASARSGRG